MVNPNSNCGSPRVPSSPGVPKSRHRPEQLSYPRLLGLKLNIITWRYTRLQSCIRSPLADTTNSSTPL